MRLFNSSGRWSQLCPKLPAWTWHRQLPLAQRSASASTWPGVSGHTSSFQFKTILRFFACALRPGPSLLCTWFCSYALKSASRRSGQRSECSKTKFEGTVINSPDQLHIQDADLNRCWNHPKHMHAFIGCRCLLHTRHVTWLQTCLSLIRLQTEGQIDLKQKHTAGQ